MTYKVQTVLTTVLSQVKKLMNNRRCVLAPFPVDPREVYKLLYTEDEWRALTILLESPKNSVLQRGAVFYIAHANLVGPTFTGVQERKYNILVRLPENAPLAHGSSIWMHALPPGVRDAIREWGPLALKYEHEMREVTEKVEELTKVCRTLGQVNRLWPELFSFFDEAGQGAILHAKAKARYPIGTVINGTLLPRFRPEAYQPFTEMIAESLMLPKTDGDFVATLEAIP